MKWREMVRWETRSGQAVVRGEVRLTPQSRALQIQWPKGGGVWNRPVAVVVESGGETRRVPIVDVTRWAQYTLLAFSLIFILTTWIRRDQNERSN